MSHLSRDELLQAVEGGDGRLEHLQSCALCRQEVEALASVLRNVAAVDVPEPSPLFWERFSARVSQGVGQESLGDAGTGARQRSRAGWQDGLLQTRPWRVVVPALVGLAIVVVMVIRSDRPGPAAVTSRQPAATAPLTQVPSGEEAGTPADEESWLVFSALATEADPAGSAFSSPAPGVAEGAVLELTDEERGELVRLLKVELAQPRVRGRG
jgi:hypothetical protein